MRRLRDRMASFALTVFERMTSDISRLRAISSLEAKRLSIYEEALKEAVSYRLLSVAFWTCSSIWELDANQPAIMFQQTPLAAGGSAVRRREGLVGWRETRDGIPLWVSGLRLQMKVRPV